jgi:hypothetical protein
MVLNLWQGLLRKCFQIRIRTVRNFILIESGVGLLVIDLTSYVIGVKRVVAFMLKGRNHGRVGVPQKCRRRRWRFVLQNPNSVLFTMMGELTINFAYLRMARVVAFASATGPEST